MADVFISYHEESAGELVAQIAAALENAEISCWYAKRDIPPGGNFPRYILSQINACKVFLLILDDNVVHQSSHIENEVGLAFGRLNRREKITILPLEIGSFERSFEPESWVRYYLVHTQSIKIPIWNKCNETEVTQEITHILGRPQKANHNISKERTISVTAKELKGLLWVIVWFLFVCCLLFVCSHQFPSF